MSIPLASGLEQLAPDYQGFIVDLWGTVHDGACPYSGVVDALGRLRDAGKQVVMLSNAPRLSPRVRKVLRRIGIGDGLYRAIVTSGDATREAVAGRADMAAQRFYHLGPDDDAGLLDGLATRRVDAIEEADFLLVTGLLTSDDRVEVHETLLRRATARNLPMVCANPDVIVLRAGVRELCAGALAQRYEALGGQVEYLGKPYGQVYESCFSIFNGMDRRRVLAVGDGLHTDIVGAQAVGIDSLLITGGLLADAWGIPGGAPPDPGRLAAACREASVRPVAAMARFVW